MGIGDKIINHETSLVVYGERGLRTSSDGGVFCYPDGQCAFCIPEVVTPTFVRWPV